MFFGRRSRRSSNGLGFGPAHAVTGSERGLRATRVPLGWAPVAVQESAEVAQEWRTARYGNTARPLSGGLAAPADQEELFVAE